MIERSLTRREVLWGGAWINFLMENADQPRYRKGTPPDEVYDNIEAAKAAFN